MVRALRQPGIEALSAAVEVLLDERRLGEVRRARDAYVADRPNLAGYIAQAIEQAVR